MKKQGQTVVVCWVEDDGDGPVLEPIFAGEVEDGVLEAMDPAPAPGSVVEVRGDGTAAVVAWPNTARAALWALMEGFKADPTYPWDVQSEVADHLADPHLDDANLDDLRAIPFVTIDNADSRDLDQALHIERQGRGYLVRYALADPSFYVRPGSALFMEALRRGASMYLPHMSVPMLPPELSEGLISLNEGVDRRAVVFTTLLDARGAPTSTGVSRARIHSVAKLSYPGVQAFYDAPASSPLRGQPFTESLELLREVGEHRITRARERDVVNYDRLRAGLVESDDRGTHLVLSTEQRLGVERYGEQLSLLCNMEGAELLMAARGHAPGTKGSSQPVYRVHDAPPPERLQELVGELGNIVAAHELDPKVWAWRGPGKQSLADYLAGLPRETEHQRVRMAIDRQVRMTNVRSVFAATVGPHYALGVAGYARFSAPMREVAGIFTHKEVLELLRFEPRSRPDDDEETREQVIESANRSKQRQSQLTKAAYKIAIDELLESDLRLPVDKRPWRKGTILGMQASRLYVQLDDPPIELKVYARDIGTATGLTLKLCEGGARLIGAAREYRLRIGDAIEVRTHGSDGRRDRWRLVPRLE